MNIKNVLFVTAFLCTLSVFAADKTTRMEHKQLPQEMISVRSEIEKQERHSFKDFVDFLHGPFEVESDLIISGLYEKHMAKVVYADERIISYSLRVENYTGGAHPNFGIYTGTIIRHSPSGKPVELRLADIVTTEQLPKMQSLIMEALKTNFRARGHNDDEINEWMKKMFLECLKPNENFYYDADGLHFIYNPYEIDCYAAGYYDLCIQWPLPKCVTRSLASAEEFKTEPEKRNSFKKFIIFLHNCAENMSDIPVGNMYEKRIVKVVYVDKQITSYFLQVENYTGGTHQNSHVYTSTINRHPLSGKPVELKLTDIVTAEQLPEMQKLILEAFKKQFVKFNMARKNNIESNLRKHFECFDVPKPNENFYYDAKGLHFVYNPHEIDCYAAGYYDLCIQWPLPKCVTQSSFSPAK